MTTKNNFFNASAKLSAIALLAISFTVMADSESDNSLNSNVWSSKQVSPQNIDIDLRSVPVTNSWQAGQAIKDMPRRRFRPDYVSPGTAKNPVNLSQDPLLSVQSSVSQQSAVDARSLDLTFDGNGFTGVNPPDPSGDVGINYYIQSINGNSGSIFTVYNKSNGSLVAGPINMETLGSGSCASGAGDPVVLFDDMAQRWLLSEFSSSGNYLCVYISKTSDPVSGGWYSYAFQSPTFPDYPKYGVGVDAYYVGTNENSPTVYALNRTAMLSGASANFIRLTAPKLAGFGFQILQPVDHDGATAMPNGTPGYFLRHRDDEVHNSSSNNPNQDYVELWQFNANFTNTNSSSITKVVDIPVAEFDSSLCGLTSFSCFPQSGSNSNLDPLREVVMFRAQYRNFGSYETIVGNFVTDVNGSDRGGIRWFELRRTGGGAWGLHQQGTYSPDSKNRWMGSIGMDKDGNIALAYSWGSSSDYAGLRYTGRLATDANGSMSQPEAILVNGTSGVSSNRWGDYSLLSLDPVDGCTFWYTNEYGKSGGQWGTHISSFKFDNCGGTPGDNQPPMASFTETCNELSCDFNGSASSDPDGSITSYAWNFGDGASATGATSAHSYATSGTYSVQLTVTDNQGATNTQSKSITVVTSPDGGGTRLVNGVAKTNLSGTTGEELFFTLEVPANATGLNFVIAGGTGDADLYVRYANQPTTSTYDCRPYKNGNAETCSISNAQAGFYHVMLRAYSTFSGVSLTGSFTVGTGGGGTFSESNIAAAKNSWKHYSIQVPAGMSSLKVDIAGGTGDADLYVRQGSQPTTSAYDCRPYKGGNSETCSFNNPAAATWYISIRGYSAFNAVNLSAEWKP